MSVHGYHPALMDITWTGNAERSENVTLSMTRPDKRLVRHRSAGLFSSSEKVKRQVFQGFSWSTRIKEFSWSTRIKDCFCWGPPSFGKKFGCYFYDLSLDITCMPLLSVSHCFEWTKFQNLIRREFAEKYNLSVFYFLTQRWPWNEVKVSESKTNMNG